MKELPKSDWTFHSDSVIVAAHEHNGYRWYTKVALANLSNDLISLDDLKRLWIYLIDARTIYEGEPL
jgi:hypothetical protein